MEKSTNQEKTFWGVVVEPGKEYKQTPKFNFHLSMAVLDLKSNNEKPVTLMVQVEQGEFILCNLTKDNPQVSLDLLFSEGEKLKFYTEGGKGSVHLTGYVMPEVDDLFATDDEFSDDESIGSEALDHAQTNKLNAKRKNTETLKLTGKDAKKLKANDGKAVETDKQAKIVDVDPKQLLDSKKKQDKPQQQKAKPQQNNAKMATKGLEVDSGSDDDQSIDEDEESVDLNKLNQLVDDDEEESSMDLNDEDLESDDDDLESDDEVAKMNALKNKSQNKSNQQQAKKGGQKNFNQKPQQVGKPNQQQQHGKPGQQQQGKPKNFFDKNKQTQGTPFNKGQQKNQQTPFQHRNQNNSNKKGTPTFQHNNKNKSFGSHNKQQNKKVFT